MSALRTASSTLLETPSVSGNYSAVTVGDVTLPVTPPQSPHLVPNSRAALPYGILLDIPEVLQHLRWMFKKAKLGQDMFLIGPPGPFRRWLAYRFCEIAQRECEYLALTRDTTEADLKQRREILNGSVVYIDQAAVRAAIHGRVLILEGIEKCERNVLPVLNNLLENREMHLEDGRFLVSPARYEHLRKTRSKEELENLRLVPVHPKFQVIALGLPVPKFEGYPLDPPLRSRFQARNITPLGAESQLSIIRTLYPKVPSDVVHRLLAFAEAVNRMQFSEELASIPRLLHLPATAVIDIARILQQFPDQRVYPLLLRVFPFDIKSDEAERAAIRAALETVGLTSILDYATQRKTTSALPGPTSRSISLKEKDTFNSLTGQHTITPFVQTEMHRALLDAILQDLKLNFAVCLVGEQGCGKTRLITKLAEETGCTLRTVQLYKDMTARDLFQRRSTNSSGDTIWINSPLVEAAVAGDIAVLDGVHRLGPGTLAALQQLIFDKESTLCDGSKLVPDIPDQNNGGTRLLKVHPNFRIVALGNPPPRSGTPKGQWLTSEVVAMFHFHNFKEIGWNTKIAIVDALFERKKQPQSKDMTAGERALNDLIDFARRLEEAKGRAARQAESQEAARDLGESISETTSDLPSFSLRQLLRACRRVSRFPEDVYEVVENTLLLRFLPPPVREAVSQVLSHSSLAKSDSLKQAISSKDIKIEVTDTHLRIGSIEWPRNTPKNPALVPRIKFVDIPNHVRLLREMTKDFILGNHILLIGNQGVGKNMLADRLLELLRLEREYIQLHRDTTVQTLTLSPSISKGVVVWEDSPLVRAVRYGRVLVIDEADKAPLEVVCVLKGLIEDGEMLLADGRRIVAQELLPRIKDLDKVIPIHNNFKLIVLANRPGFPFLGNNFFRECGDCFAVHIVDNPDRDSEMALLKAYGPHVDEGILSRLISLFSDLRIMVDRGQLTYPYSLRELVNIVKHLEAFPNDSLIQAIDNVFHFDSYDLQLREHLVSVFHKHGVPLSSTVFVDFKVKLAEEKELPKPIPTSKWFIESTGSVSSRSQQSTNLECIVSEYPLHPQASWPVNRSGASPITTKQFGRIHTFTEERAYFTMEVKGKPHSMATTEDGAIHVFSSNPLQVVTFPAPYNTYTVTRLDDHIHTFYYNEPADLTVSTPIIAGLPGGRIALFFAAFNMLLVISEQKVEPFELPDIDGGRSFTVVNNSVFVNRQLRQALLRKERYRNGVNLLQMRDSLSHKGILVFYRHIGTDFYVVNTNTNRLWHVRTAENVQILDFHVVAETMFLVRSRNDTKYLIIASPELPNTPRRFIMHAIQSEALSTEIMSPLLALSSHHFIACDSSYPTLLSSMHTFVQMADGAIADLLRNKNANFIINSFVRGAKTARKSDSLYTIQLRKSNNRYVVNLCFSPGGYYDDEDIPPQGATTNKRPLFAPSPPHYVLEVVDVHNKTYRDVKVRTGTKAEKTIVEAASLQEFSVLSSSASRVQKIISVCELPNGDVACLSEDGRIVMLEVSRETLEAQVGKWKQLIGLVDNSNTEKEKPLRLTFEYDGKKETSEPKHGKVDPTNAPHIGGNTWAGGVGGADTAGLGGRGGPYRLNAGHDVYQVSMEEKAKVSAEANAAARQMAKQALAERLASIEMSEFDEGRYQSIMKNIKQEIRQLRAVLESVQAKDRERTWRKLETTGEIDENRLVDGITGARNVYKRRGEEDPHPGAFQEKPKRMRFVIDISGSMYRFDMTDRRLQRMLDVTLLIMESLRGFEHKYSYSIVGHSGDSPEVLLVDYNKPPKNAKERMQILDKMVAHSQYCSTGDFTLKATELAVKNVVLEEADDYFVFVFSDANLSRYDIRPHQIAERLQKDPRVHSYIIFIASLADEAARIKNEMPLGKAFVAMDPSTLVFVFKQIFMSNAVTGGDD